MWLTYLLTQIKNKHKQTKNKKNPPKNTKDFKIK
jgi:hypothetical protein